METNQDTILATHAVRELLAKAERRASAAGLRQVSLECLLGFIPGFPLAMDFMTECLGGLSAVGLKDLLPEAQGWDEKSGKTRLDDSPELQAVLQRAKTLAGQPDFQDVHQAAGTVNQLHLACALLLSQAAMKMMAASLRPGKSVVEDELQSWMSLRNSMELPEQIHAKLGKLRGALLGEIIGQEHAVQTFVEGLFQARMSTGADPGRTRPSAVFVFAGPPGVGKTYLAERSARLLDMPYQRFDMTGYADPHAMNHLVGFEESFRGAQPGLLTDFVNKNPKCLLLFDEVEKAHTTTMQLFYQMLDAGVLEDRYLGETVQFRDAVVIFTTNAGRTLYDTANRGGAGHGRLHRRTIISALESETNPADGRPAFPRALCSRLSQGYPVMFNQLRLHHLQLICQREMSRFTGLLRQAHHKEFSFDSLIPTLLLLREGGHSDARHLTAEVSKFVSGQIVDYLHHQSQAGASTGLSEFVEVLFELDLTDGSTPEALALLQSKGKPRVLLVGGGDLAARTRRAAPQVDWEVCPTHDKMPQRDDGLDLALVDLWLEPPVGDQSQQAVIQGIADQQEDGRKIGLSHPRLQCGRRSLELLRDRLPRLPIYLLDTDRQAPPPGDEQGVAQSRSIGPELLGECVRLADVRGVLSMEGQQESAPETKRGLGEALESITRLCHLERKAGSLARERKVLAFDTHHKPISGDMTLKLIMKNFRLERAVEAADAAHLLESVQRPETRFSHVIGAEAAKDSLKFIADWLGNRDAFLAGGVRPPRGVLLAGPPGTGKTMLARALAGESSCAFLEASATGFVTMWQGSGPANIRELFQRARRYAPAVVFIDELDAIGARRVGGMFSRAQENTLNALLVEMDGFNTKSNPPVVVVAASNLPGSLDPALMRRFDRVIELEMPDRAQRLQYVKDALERATADGVDDDKLKNLAGRSLGLTIADLEKVVHLASQRAANGGRALDMGMVDEALDDIMRGGRRPSPDQAGREGAAVHEAGHALMAGLHGNDLLQVTILGRGGAGGHTQRDVDEARAYQTKGELEQMLREALAGRAAEMIRYGQDQGMSTGAASDLRMATALAMRMVGELGMSEELGPLCLAGLPETLRGALAEKVHGAVAALLKTQMELAVAMLKENQAALDKIAGELLAKECLTGDELKALVDRRGAYK